MSATKSETQNELKEIKIILKALLFQVERMQHAKRISHRQQNSTPFQDGQLTIEFPEEHEATKGSNA